MSGIELATAYVTIAPSTKGVGASITRDFTKAGDEGGKQAGSRFSSRFRRGSDSAATQTESRFGKTAKKMAIAFAGVFAVKKGISFLTGMADSFKGAVGETVKLRRFLGGSVEDASRLRFVAQQVGIDSDKFARGLGLFNKNLVTGKLDAFIGKTKDANGQLLPMSQLLPKVAERFANMPEGPEKTALAMKLFGKAGADLIPLLNKGQDGIAELMAKADELGVTLGDKDVDAMKEANANSRLWKSSLEAIRIQIGRYVLPILSKFTGFLTRNVPKAIGIVRQVLGVLFKRDFTGGPLSEDSPIVDNLFKFRDLVASIVPKVQAGFQRIVKAVSPLVGAVRRFFATDPRARFAAVAAVLGGVFLGAVVAVATAIAGLFSPIYLVVAAVAAVAFGVIYAYKRFDGFRKVVDGVARWLVGTAWPAVQSFGVNTIDLFRRIATWAKTHWAQVKTALLIGVGALTGLAGAAVYAYVRFAGFRAVVDAIVKWLVTSAWPAVQRFAVGVVGAFRSAAEWTRTHWAQIKAPILAVATWITVTAWPALRRFAALVAAKWSDLVAYTRRVWPGISDAIRNVVTVVVTVVTRFAQILLAVFQATARLVLDVWNRWGDNLLRIAKTVWSFIVSTVRNGLQLIRGIIQTVTSIFRGDWAGAWEGIKQIAGALLKQIGNIIARGLGVIRQLVGMAVDLLGAIWTRLWDGIKAGAAIAARWVGDRIGDLVGFVNSIPGRIATTIASLWSGLMGGMTIASTWVGDRIDDVVGFVVGLPDRITDAVAGAFDGIKEGFRLALNWVIDRWNEFKLPKQHIKGTDIDIGGYGLPHIDPIEKFHRGGIVPGRTGREVPILAQAGERVLTARQNDAYEAGQGGGMVFNGPVSFGDNSHHTRRDLELWSMRKGRAVRAA